MSLLKRIETIRSGSTGQESVVEVVPAPTTDAEPSFSSRSGPVAQVVTPQAQRLINSVPVRESFREAKFRVQARVISELDPKLDLGNQTAVRQQIEAVFGRILDEEGLALTRAE